MDEAEYEVNINGQIVDLPEGARWLAQDELGNWVFFNRKPTAVDSEPGYWDGPDKAWPSIRTDPPEDFQSEIYRTARER